MKYFILLLVCAVAGGSLIEATAPPGYVQTEINGIDLQMNELKLQRAQLIKQLAAIDGDGNELQKSQLNAEIQQVNTQLQFLEQQKRGLLESQDNGQ